MIEVRQNAVFRKWFSELRDVRAKIEIARRLDRAENGNLGDAKFFDGIGEMRIVYGPGYRVYFVQRGRELIILLCGGDKGSQSKDIQKAKKLAKEV